MKRERAGRRFFARAALIALGSLLLLELVLQIGALAVALFVATPQATHEDGRKVVLCVGDSFTYGLGASDQETKSYPAQLQSLLDAAEPGAWRVVNEGYPGRNSRQLLERLGEQIERLAPDQVCILVGLNDRWSHPEELVLAAGGATAPGSFRLEVRTLRLWRWLVSKFRGHEAIVGSRTVFAPRLPADDPWRAVDANTASEEQRRQVDRIAADPDSAASLARALAGRGANTDAARARVDGLRDAKGPDLPLLRAIAMACAKSAPTTALRAAVLAFVLTGSRTAFADELRAGTAQDPTQLDEVIRALGLARSEREEVDALFATTFGWREADGIWIQPSTGAQRALVDIRWQEVGPEALRDFEVHRAHLLQAFELCRAKGATALLLGYPNRTSFPDEFLLDLSRRGGVPFLSTVQAIESHLAKVPGALLFVADGHCNDEGYGLMAEVVSRFLHKRG